MVNTFSEPTKRFTGICGNCDTPQQLEVPDTSRDSLKRACVDCNATVKVIRIYATYSDHNCAADCVSAIGPQCSCSCRGENHGTGWKPVVKDGEYLPSDAVIEHRNRAAAKKEAAAARALAQREADRQARLAEWSEWSADHTDIIEYVTDSDHTWGFMIDMAERVEQKQTLTPKQVSVIRRSIQRDAEREAARKNASPVPTGRVEITGKIVKVVSRKVQRGYTTGTEYKLTIESPDGWKVWITAPKNIKEIVYYERNYEFESLVGETLSLTVTVSASKNDETFGFGSRPSKAKLN